jgi:hypothetical protein
MLNLGLFYFKNIYIYIYIYVFVCFYYLCCRVIGAKFQSSLLFLDQFILQVYLKFY